MAVRTNGAAAKRAAAKPKADNGTRVIPAIKRVLIHAELKSTAPLIQHKWSEKAKKAMRDKQQGAAKARKEPKNPDAEFEAAKYLLPDGRPGIPAVAFKAAIVDAARLVGDAKMTHIRPSVYVQGYGPDMLVPIVASPAVLREDMVRVGMGTSDLRYRPMYEEWTATLEIQLLSHVITEEVLFGLLDGAGYNGVGEWRPEKNGVYGTFTVTDFKVVG